MGGDPFRTLFLDDQQVIGGHPLLAREALGGFSPLAGVILCRRKRRPDHVLLSVRSLQGDVVDAHG